MLCNKLDIAILFTNGHNIAFRHIQLFTDNRRYLYCLRFFVSLHDSPYPYDMSYEEVKAIFKSKLNQSES
ncbi:hypothetical protein SAMD00079811_24540 [Scytonema sp. HK-05]|nr:hypothetical protein SAMD00079811_24540 [Scytonema sp. HK-05]